MGGLKVRTANIRYVLLGLFVALMSCNGQKKAADTGGGDNTSKLTMVLRDNYAASDRTETLVVRDEKSLRKFFSKINRTRKPGIPVPKVDFSREMVIIYCSGAQKMGTQPSLSVIGETGAQVIMGMAQEHLDGDQISTASIRPFAVYKIPATEKEITFRAIE